MLSFPMPLRVQPQLDFICSYEDWQSVSADHILTGTGVKDTDLAAYVIEKTPTVYISGTKEALTPSPDGYVYNTLVTVSSDYNNERIAMKLMGFGTTENVTEADVVVGGYGLDEESLAAVQNGAPYVGFTMNAVEIVQESLLPGIQTGSADGVDCLGYVTYPEETLVNASYIKDGDDLSTQVISRTGTTYSMPSVRTTLRLCPKARGSLYSVTAAALLWKAYFTVMMRVRTLS